MPPECIREAIMFAIQIILLLLWLCTEVGGVSVVRMWVMYIIQSLAWNVTLRYVIYARANLLQLIRLLCFIHTWCRCEIACYSGVVHIATSLSKYHFTVIMNMYYVWYDISHRLDYINVSQRLNTAHKSFCLVSLALILAKTDTHHILFVMYLCYFCRARNTVYVCVCGLS